VSTFVSTPLSISIERSEAYGPSYVPIRYDVPLLINRISDFNFTCEKDLLELALINRTIFLAYFPYFEKMK
jgi:hypothetical protein